VAACLTLPCCSCCRRFWCCLLNCCTIWWQAALLEFTQLGGLGAAEERLTAVQDFEAQLEELQQLAQLYTVCTCLCVVRLVLQPGSPQGR
jgi:hypothetical protein